MPAALPLQGIPDGLVAVVKRDCPTCVIVEPVLRQLAAAGSGLPYADPGRSLFPADVPCVVDDTGLGAPFALGIGAADDSAHRARPRDTTRAVGWHRGEWEDLTGMRALGLEPAERPGCGSLSTDPSIADELAIRLGAVTFKSRKVGIGDHEDEIEACFDRDWTDGLPVVPPTHVRVHRMLQGTRRSPNEVLGRMPPDYEPCTVEKVAINAVMAGCRPDYLPVVIAAVEAALDRSRSACMPSSRR